MFDREMEFFKRNQNDLVAKHRGRVLVIRGDEVVGVHADPLTAYLETKDRYEPGTFMIQPCTPGPEAYTVTITAGQ